MMEMESAQSERDGGVHTMVESAHDGVHRVNAMVESAQSERDAHGLRVQTMIEIARILFVHIEALFWGQAYSINPLLGLVTRVLYSQKHKDQLFKA